MRTTRRMVTLSIALRVSEKLKASGFRLQASGFRLQASGFRLQVPGLRLPGSSQGGVELIPYWTRLCQHSTVRIHAFDESRSFAAQPRKKFSASRSAHGRTTFPCRQRCRDTRHRCHNGATSTSREAARLLMICMGGHLITSSCAHRELF
jgi:hypothetical protein